MDNIKFVNTVVIGKRVPLGTYYPESIFLLLRITANREFVDGAWTDKITGHTYECVDTIDFKHLKVKVEGQETPLMEGKKLQEIRKAKEKVAVEFVNPTVMPYINERRQSIEDSYKADDVLLVKN